MLFNSNQANVEFDVSTLTYTDHNSKDPKEIQVSSKSELFRQLYDAGMEVAEISKATGSHYSFVHGVIANSREMRTTKKVSKSDTIRFLAAIGKTPGEIAKELQSNYSFVFSVVKAFKASPGFEQAQKDALAKLAESQKTELAATGTETTAPAKKATTKKAGETK